MQSTESRSESRNLGWTFTREKTASLQCSLSVIQTLNFRLLPSDILICSLDINTYVPDISKLSKENFVFRIGKGPTRRRLWIPAKPLLLFIFDPGFDLLHSCRRNTWIGVLTSENWLSFKVHQSDKQVRETVITLRIKGENEVGFRSLEIGGCGGWWCRGTVLAIEFNSLSFEWSFVTPKIVAESPSIPFRLWPPSPVDIGFVVETTRLGGVPLSADWFVPTKELRRK